MLSELKILLVEDDIVLALSLKAYLGVYNHVLTTPSLREARELRGTFDLILLDRHLPDGTGLEAIPHFRKYFPNSAIVIVTGDTDFLGVAECLKAGADDYLFKTSHLLQDLMLRVPLVLKRNHPCELRAHDLRAFLPTSLVQLKPIHYAKFRTQAERSYLQETLRLTDGDVTVAARRLGLGRSTLFKKISGLGITKSIVIETDGNLSDVGSQ